MKYFLSLVLFLSSNLLAKEISFMAYNIENLFDTKYDEGTEDYVFLSLKEKQKIEDHEDKCREMRSHFQRNQCFNLDWNQDRFLKKAQSIGKVVRSFDATGRGADILVLEEVENQNALDQLVQYGLAGMGYKYAKVIEGDDSRGIDVAVVSKFPIVWATHHSIYHEGRKLDTRGILEAHIQTGKDKIVVFANHWPSQGNPTSHRIASAKLLSELMNKVKADFVIAMGDFNTIDEDFPHPFGYLNAIVDVEKEARQAGYNDMPGTYNYRGSWNSLDKIFVRKQDLSKTWKSSYKILAERFMLVYHYGHNELIPYRYNHEESRGFSDHLPVGVKADI